MRKKLIILAVALTLVGGATGYYYAPASEAQRNTPVRFEYAVINGSYLPYPADSASSVSGAVNICYVLGSGCHNEEVRTDLNLSKFIQDERLENSAASKRLAQERAFQTSFSRAIAKLGADGWEMVGAPAIEFDLYYTNPQGIQSVKEGTKGPGQHVWFERERQ